MKEQGTYVVILLGRHEIRAENLRISTDAPNYLYATAQSN